jgi:energy-coupling factor transporter ATP-binding protein EcfA2
MSNFYNTNNARYLEPNQVAKNFIYSHSFQKLLKNMNTIILGARGCGKTTLMKMLTLPALYEWSHSRSDEIRREIPFYAIYISTDIYWEAKNDIYENQLAKFGSFANKISHFSVNSNVFYSLCSTFQNIIEFEIKPKDSVQEVELCKILIDTWKLESTIPLLVHVKESIKKRISDVSNVVQDVIFNYSESQPLPNDDFYNLQFDSSSSYLTILR